MARTVRTHVSPEEPMPAAPKHMTKQEFARKLYQAMMKRGWHQSELARQSGLNRDAVSVYIRGKSLPAPTSLKRLADALGVLPGDLLPNYIESAIEEDIPALDIKVSANAPSKAWLRVNQLVDVRTAVQIAELLNGPADGE